MNPRPILGIVLVACGLIALNPSLWPFAAGAGTVAFTAYLGGAAIAIGILFLAAAGIQKLKAHAVALDHGSPGALIRWAFFYDLLVAALTFGREVAMREAILDIAQVDAGHYVLDVGCGTGTLAIAAKRRVGPTGIVHGVDAAAQMAARANTKSKRGGFAIAFEVAIAQSLPFPDRCFDIALCTLVLHHIPEGARKHAVAEMRRILKPGGRLLVVEMGASRGVWAVLNPIALLHGHSANRMLREVDSLLRDGGFERVTTGPLGFGVLGYVLGESRPEHYK